VERWIGCFYVGETGRTHEEIQEAGVYPPSTPITHADSRRDGDI
jgi:hypothetical protein